MTPNKAHMMHQAKSHAFIVNSMLTVVLGAACPNSNRTEPEQQDSLWGEPLTSGALCSEENIGKPFSITSANLWAPQLMAMSSTAVVVSGDAAFIVASVNSADQSADRAVESSLRRIDLMDLGVLISSSKSVIYGGDARKPVTVMPTPEANFRTIAHLLQASSLAYMQISWCTTSRGLVATEAWLSTSLWLPELSSTSEFYFAAGSSEHDLVLLGPNLRQECKVPLTDFGPCTTLTERSQLTRVLVCGYNTWGEAMRDMEDTMSRVTEVAVSEYCSEADRPDFFPPPVRRVGE
jgi:hypothetical protein